MTETSHFDDATRTKLSEEMERLGVIHQRWHQEHFRLKDEAEKALEKANKAKWAKAAIQQLLEVGKMELPSK